MTPGRWRPRRRVMPNGNVVWVARYKDRRGRIRIAKPAWNGGNGTFALKREAQRAIDEALEQNAPDRQETVAGYLDGWLDRHPRAQRTERTYAVKVRAILTVEVEGLPLGEWDMRDLRRRHAHELVAHMLLDQGRAPGGARAVLRSLSAMAEDAITDDLAGVNPWRGVKVREDDRRARKAPREIRVWSFEEMHAFAAEAGRLEPLVRVLADCGLRIGEALALRRSELDIGRAVLRVEGSEDGRGHLVESSGTKNHDREVPIPAGCLALLRAMPVRIDTPWLFPARHGGLRNYSNFRRDIWLPACERSGLDPTPHEFRHSWVSHLRAVGVDPADLAEIAGHSMATASGHYTHALGHSFDRVREAIG